ncbi:MAG: hypothetical protein ACOYYJ_22040 [Chloroflexota bacterium]
MPKVTDLIDIEAPCEEVFAIVVDNARRMQLSPFWGTSDLLEVSPDFPKIGSRYRVRLSSDAPIAFGQAPQNVASNALSGLAQVLFIKCNQAGLKQKQQPGLGSLQEAVVNRAQTAGTVVQEYRVAAYDPPHQFSYALQADCKTTVTWRFQGIPFGCRVSYEEQFCDEVVRSSEFIPALRRVIREWLSNLKRYSALRGSRGRLFVKWLLDRFYLRLRPDQRRVVLMMVFMQAVGLIAFALALFGWGFTHLLVWFYSLGS